MKRKKGMGYFFVVRSPPARGRGLKQKRLVRMSSWKRRPPRGGVD